MKPKGATMIEMVIGVAIFITAMIVVISLFIFHTQLYKVQEAIGTMKINGAFFTKYFQEIGGEAKTVYSSWTFNGIPHTSSSSTVIFQLPAVDSENNIIIGLYDYVAFYKDGNNLYMETDADPSSQRHEKKQRISDKVESLLFRYDTNIPSDAKSVNAYLGLSSNTTNQKINLTVNLRNKE